MADMPRLPTEGWIMLRKRAKLVVNSSEGWCIRPGPMEQSIYQCVSTINTGRIAATMVFGLQHSLDA
jgi:hypothetical protein